MSYPRLIVSDLHCHKWTAFSTTLASGVNSRLQIICDELYRAAQTLKSLGGKTIIVAGDIFHTRGSIDPEVFNPVFDLFTRLSDEDFEIIVLPGNHDLASKDTTALSNAVQSLEKLVNVTVVTKPALFPTLDMYMVPWINDLKELRRTLKDASKALGSSTKDIDVIIHAGIDGVIAGMPAHSLSAKELADLGFNRIFAGHYHHHKVMEDGKVISIGATTHHTWSDVGTQAGFIIVESPTKFRFYSSNAPRFVDISDTTPQDEYDLIADGNYVRVRDLKLTEDEIRKLRESLIDDGALGVSIQIARENVGARTTSSKSVSTLEVSIAKYINDRKFDNLADVKMGALDVLTHVKSFAA